MRTFLSILAAALLFVSPGPAQTSFIGEQPLADARVQVNEWNTDQAKRFGSSTNHLVRPGLIADKQKREVLIKGLTTAVHATEPIEFFLISPQSGHQYEALAMSFALPSHIHEALQFIGLQPGHPVEARSLHTWPKGERVAMTFSWNNQTMRVENLIFHKKYGRALPAKGLIFTGSVRTNDQYAADTEEPAQLPPTTTPTKPFSMSLGRRQNQWFMVSKSFIPKSLSPKKPR